MKPFLILFLLLTALVRADVETLQKQVDELYRAGKHAQAIPLAEQLVAEAERKFGAESLQTASGLSYLGLCRLAAGAPKEALAPFQRALAIYEKVAGPETAHTAVALNNLGDNYRALDQPEKAVPLLLRALPISQKVRGEEHVTTLVILANLGVAYFELDDYAGSEEWTRKALVLREKVLGPEALPTAASRHWLGRALSQLNQARAAEAALLQALAVREKLLGGDHADTVATLQALAAHYRLASDYSQAEAYTQRALSACEKKLGPEHARTLAAQNELALLLSDKGDHARALELFQKVLTARERLLGPEHSTTALSVNNLAYAYQRMGAYDKAEPLFLRAVAIVERRYPDSPLTATYLSNLADLYRETGALLQAESLYRRVLALREKVLGPRDPDTASTLLAIGALYYDNRDSAQAVPYYKRALEIWEEVLGPDHRLTALALTSLGMAYQRLGDPAQAQGFLERGMAIREKLFGPEHPHLTANLTCLADVKRGQGDAAGAKPLAERALRLAQSHYGPDHPSTTRSLENLLLIELDLRNADRARELAHQAQTGNDRRLATLLAYTSERRRLEYVATTNAYSGLVGAGEPADIALSLLRHKALVLDSLLEDAQAAQRSPATRAVLARLVAARERYLAQPPGPGREQVAREVERLEGELSIGKSRRALSITLEQVQAVIPPEAVLVEYLSYQHYLGRGQFEPRYGACLIASQGSPVWVELGPRAPFESAIKLSRRALSRDSDSQAAALKSLYELAWAPLAARMPSGTRRVILSPDGDLSFVSFATLLTPDDKFLAQQFEISYVGTGRDLLRQSQAGPGGPLVLVGDPNFSAAVKAPLQVSASRDLAAEDVRGIKLGPLPGTARECEALAAFAREAGWPVQRLERESATEPGVRAIQAPAVLHLATHGFFLPEAKDQALVNPMRRSGLALSGAETTLTAWGEGKFPAADQDGILTAEEVSALDLSRTWLVTLSACDTGRGEAVSGEGVMGLRRGFVQAGTANLMLTLWRVSDEHTGAFMNDFYRAARESGSPTRALSQVQAAWLVRLRQERSLAEAVRLAGPFVMTFQGKP